MYPDPDHPGPAEPLSPLTPGEEDLINRLVPIAEGPGGPAVQTPPLGADLRTVGAPPNWGATQGSDVPDLLTAKELETLRSVVYPDGGGFPFTDPNGPIPGSVLNPSPDAFRLGPDQIAASQTLPPGTSALDPSALNPSTREVTAGSVFGKLTKKETGEKYLLTEEALNKLLERSELAAVDKPRTPENLGNLRAQLDKLSPEELNELNKNIDTKITDLERKRAYQKTEAGRAAKRRHAKSPKGIAAKEEYKKSGKRKKHDQKYKLTPNGQATNRKYNQRRRARKKAEKADPLAGLRLPPPDSSGGSSTPFNLNDCVVDGVGKSSRGVPVSALMGGIFAAAGFIVGVLADLNGWGGAESEKKLRAGAAGLGDGAEQSGSVTARQGGWVGRAAEAYDSDSATLAGLQAVMADTDTATAALLQAHDQRLEITRTVIDSTDALLTVSDPIAVALEALPGTGPALSVAFQLSVAVPALHACYSAEQHALHSSARTAAALQDATTTYDYIHTTATQLTSLT